MHVGTLKFLSKWVILLSYPSLSERMVDPLSLLRDVPLQLIKENGSLSQQNTKRKTNN
jgi:hypothetical protein